MAERKIQTVKAKEVAGAFVLVTDFSLTVPLKYKHSKQLTKFRRAHKKELATLSEDITDKNFSKVTAHLRAGQKLKVEIFRGKAKSPIFSDRALEFLHSRKAILAGAQGASLILELAKENLPKNKPIAFFDKKSALWVHKYGGVKSHTVPFILAGSVDVLNGKKDYFSFELACFEDALGSSCYIVCILEEKPI